MKKTLLAVLSLIVIAIFSLSYASAWGVSGYYTRDKPLMLAPGETNDDDVIFTLQNSGEDDLRIKVEVLNGTEYAEIIGATEYDLPGGGISDVVVNVRVTAPYEEDSYLIGISFATITSGEGQGVTMGEQIVRNFYLISTTGAPPAEEKEAAELGGIGIWFYIVLGVIAIAIILIMIFAPRKKKEKVVKSNVKPKIVKKK